MPLPIALDDDARRRLLLVKEMYRTGLEEARAPVRTYQRILAVVTLDLACETLAKAVVWSLGNGAKPKETYRDLLPQAQAAAAKAAGDAKDTHLPGQGGAWRLHDIRNDAQHNTVVPGDDTLNDCRTYARDFVLGVVSRVWDYDLEVLTAADAIPNDRLRTLIGEAEAALAVSNWTDAARKAKAALDWARYMATAAHFGQRYGMRFSAYQYSDAFGPHPLSRFSREVERELDDLRRTLHAVAVGADLAKDQRLRALTGHRRGTLRSESWSKPQVRAAEADGVWAVAYATDAILGLEASHGPLHEPE